MPTGTEHDQGGIEIRTSDSVTIGGDVVGRDKIVVFVNGEMPAEAQFNSFLDQIGIQSNRSRFAASQYETYVEAWRSLQALRLAGDDLWEEANVTHLATFAKQLDKTGQVVREGELFFEAEDRKDLLAVMNIFANYHFGKTRLIDMAGGNQPEGLFDSNDWLRQTIAENYRHKTQYDAVLDRVRESFRERISN